MTDGLNRTFAIDADQVRAAWKILQTLAEEYALSTPEQSFLLHNVSAVALRNSLDTGEIEWTGDNRRLRIFIVHSRVEAEEDTVHPVVLHPGITDEEANTAYKLAERLLDHHEMPEHERAGLYSALPCLGFHALQGGYLQWRIAPPFKGITSKPQRRGIGKKRPSHKKKVH